MNTENAYEEVIKYLEKRLEELGMTLIIFGVTKTRLEELISKGYKFVHFRMVIDHKIKKWKDTEFRKFIRPETLFGNKFETYLYESRNATTIQKLANSIQSAKELIDRSVVKLRGRA
jgi:uncharacterized phage protein (TIGR02220 family)